MGSFTADLKAFQAKTDTKINEAVREIVLGVGERLIDRSPVGAPETWKRKPPPGYKPGRFKSNWNYGLQTPDIHTTDRTDLFALNNLEELPAKPAGFVHFLTNSLPYGPALERGHSQQAPQGMVGLTAQEFPQIVEAAARKVNP